MFVLHFFTPLFFFNLFVNALLQNLHEWQKFAGKDQLIFFPVKHCQKESCEFFVKMGINVSHFSP